MKKTKTRFGSIHTKNWSNVSFDFQRHFILPNTIIEDEQHLLEETITIKHETSVGRDARDVTWTDRFVWLLLNRCWRWFDCWSGRGSDCRQHITGIHRFHGRSCTRMLTDTIRSREFEIEPTILHKVIFLFNWTKTSTYAWEGKSERCTFLGDRSPWLFG